MSTADIDLLFKAIADPTRREILNLTSKPEQNLGINEIAERFSMSRQAVTKHIKVLQDAGLVSIDTEGRKRFCRADLSSLESVADWVNGHDSHWTRSVNSLDAYLSGKKG